MNLIVILLCCVAAPASGFTDYGVGAKVAEMRGFIAAATPAGKRVVLCTVSDRSPRGYILATDLDRGETRQVYCPSGVPRGDPFGSLFARTGKFYTAQGKWLLEFDPDAGRWTFHGVPSKRVSVFLCFIEGPDRVVWAGAAYGSRLVSFDPRTRRMKDHGRMDPKEDYLFSLAVDRAGWVYAGIGTARCNIVAYNPRTGEKRSLVPESERKLGSGVVYPTADGAAFGRAGKRRFRLYAGQAEPWSGKPPARASVRDIHYGGRLSAFPDGSRVTAYDLGDRVIKFLDARTKREKTIRFDYETEGAGLTSLAGGPDDVVYASSCHPMRLVALDTRRSALRDLGGVPAIGGGNFCAIASLGRQVFGAEYGGGRLWRFDVDQPWRPNPPRKVLGVPARTLVKRGKCKHGHFTYLPKHDAAFLCGDRFGAEGTFPLSAPADGRYYLHVLPYHAPSYSDVQFLFDGRPLGPRYRARRSRIGPGETLVFGPMNLRAGEHALTLRILETKGQKPWAAVVSAALSRRRIERLLVQPAANPTVLAQWKRDICRPRTILVHPDGRHVIMAGYAGYGLCGGGVGIYDLKTGRARLLTAERDLVRGQSVITIKALPNGDLVAGTSVNAPGGGHPIAKTAELVLIDWKTKKLAFHAAPLPGERSLISIEVMPDGLVYGLSAGSTFFVFDPRARKVVHKESFRAYGGVPRHALQKSAAGELYAIMSRAILRIRPGEFAHEKLADAPASISAGGALVNGRLYFAVGSHLWSYRLPGR